MLRREFIRWLARITGGYVVINLAPGLSPLKKINTTLFREAWAQDSCTEDTCITDNCGATDTEGHTCTVKDVCVSDASDDCTNDECTSDRSGTCSGDRCISDSSGDCTNDGGPATGCTTCDGDTCTTCDADSGCTLCDADTCTECDADTCGSDTSGYCSSDASGPCTNDSCTSDKSGECETDTCRSDSSGGCEGDACRSDSSGECVTNQCTSDSSKGCQTDTCVSDSSGKCQTDTCVSDSSGECETDKCVSDSSGGCADDSCVSDKSGGCSTDTCVSDKSSACKNDTCKSDSSGSGGDIDPSCEEDFTEGSGSDDCVSDSSGACLVDKCNTDKSNVCTQQDVCVLDQSGACDSDLCREDVSPACTASDTCSKDVAMNMGTTRRRFAKAGINSAIKWLYKLSMITLFVGMVYGTSHAETVIDSRNAIFSPSATYNTSQSVSVPDPVGPFLRDCDGDGILEADTDGDGLCDGDPEVKDYNGDSTRELPDSTSFTGNFEFTCFHIPDDVAIISTGALSIKASEEVAIFGAVRLNSGVEISTPGKIDLRTSAWLSGTTTSVIFNTALSGEVDETQTAYGDEDSVPSIEYTSICVVTPTPTAVASPTPTAEVTQTLTPATTPSPTPAPTESPTVITLVSFKARTISGGNVVLTWETAAEIDNAGFNIYRARSEGGTYTKINSALIAAKSNASSGSRYKFMDTPGEGRFYYKLEDVDNYGVSAMHGPVKVRVRSAEGTARRRR